ncbi:MAG: sigma-70 family RNA polymerase sigma factor [Lachnospiraceae bacterium]|nr:sigma-70 family RNA polymerase sigma factor [Lachnospiraceae bacterium]
MDDEEIFCLFFDRSEQAIAEVEKKYGKLCRQIAFRILGNEEDGEECISDVCLAAWDSIPPLKPNSLRAWLCQTTRNLALKAWRDNHARKRYSEYTRSLDELKECIPARETVEEVVLAQELTELVEKFLETLDAEKRNLFMRRYWLAESVKEIAASRGISQRNASMQLLRIRKKLYQYLLEQGVSL